MQKEMIEAISSSDVMTKMAKEGDATAELIIIATYLFHGKFLRLMSSAADDKGSVKGSVMADLIAEAMLDVGQRLQDGIDERN